MVWWYRGSQFLTFFSLLYKCQHILEMAPELCFHGLKIIRKVLMLHGKGSWPASDVECAYQESPLEVGSKSPSHQYHSTDRCHNYEVLGEWQCFHAMTSEQFFFGSKKDRKRDTILISLHSSAKTALWFLCALSPVFQHTFFGLILGKSCYQIYGWKEIWEF